MEVCSGRQGESSQTLILQGEGEAVGTHKSVDGVGCGGYSAVPKPVGDAKMSKRWDRSGVVLEVGEYEQKVP